LLRPSARSVVQGDSWEALGCAAFRSWCDLPRGLFRSTVPGLIRPRRNFVIVSYCKEAIELCRIIIEPSKFAARKISGAASTQSPSSPSNRTGPGRERMTGRVTWRRFIVWFRVPPSRPSPEVFIRSRSSMPSEMPTSRYGCVGDSGFVTPARLYRCDWVTTSNTSTRCRSRAFPAASAMWRISRRGRLGRLVRRFPLRAGSVSWDGGSEVAPGPGVVRPSRLNQSNHSRWRAVSSQARAGRPRAARS